MEHIKEKKNAIAHSIAYSPKEHVHHVTNSNTKHHRLFLLQIKILKLNILLKYFLQIKILKYPSLRAHCTPNFYLQLISSLSTINMSPFEPNLSFP